MRSGPSEAGPGLAAPPPAAAAEAPSRIAAFWRRHDVLPGEAVWGAAHALFFALIVAAWLKAGIRQAPWFLAMNVATLAAVLALRPRMRAARGGVWWILRHWYPVLFYGMFFLESGVLVPALNPREYDLEMIRADRWLTGGDPTVALQRLHHPVLTEFLQICYFSYYFLPLIVGAQVLARHGARSFQDALGRISIGFYASYVCYFFVPVVGPRFHLSHDVPLSGLLVFDFLHRFIVVAEGRMHDCFPSGHTAITLISLGYAWRLHRPTFWAILPLGSGLIFATVYLRYHYLIDLVAAVPFALAVVLISPSVLQVFARWRGEGEGAEAAP